MDGPALEYKLHRVAPEPAWEGLRLKEVLARAIPALGSRPRVLAVTNGLVSRDGRVLSDLDCVMTEAGGPLEVDLRHGYKGAGEPRRPPLTDRMRVVFEDEHLLVVDKGIGVTVQPEGEEGGDEGRGRPLVELIQHYWRLKQLPSCNPILVQRLDRDTSGLLVVAKTLPVARELQKDLTDRRIKRTYRALVAGRVESRSGSWKSHLARGRDGRWGSVPEAAGDSPTVPGRSRQRGRLAISHYRVVENRGGNTLLELDLETGRTHQLRIHCAEAGHPILGDRIYGRTTGAKDSRRGDDADRLHLHACALTFRHPKTRKMMSFESPAPF